METKTIETPGSKQKLEIKTRVLGFDQEAIDNAIYQEPTSDSDPMYGLTPEMRANRMSITRLVVSVDGRKENVADAVLGMELRDYKFVIKSLNDLTAEDAKKK